MYMAGILQKSSDVGILNKDESNFRININQNQNSNRTLASKRCPINPHHYLA